MNKSRHTNKTQHDPYQKLSRRERLLRAKEEKETKTPKLIVDYRAARRRLKNQPNPQVSHTLTGFTGKKIQIK